MIKPLEHVLSLCLARSRKHRMKKTPLSASSRAVNCIFYSKPNTLKIPISYMFHCHTRTVQTTRLIISLWGCYLFSDPEEEKNLSLIYSCLQMSWRGFALDLAFDMQEGQQTVSLSPTSCKCVCLLQPWLVWHILVPFMAGM